jgi:hypothetical protein
MAEQDDLEQVRDEVYQRVDEWIDARRDLEAADASGDPDAITAAEEAEYEAAIAVAEPVLGDMLRDRMWKETVDGDRAVDASAVFDRHRGLGPSRSDRPVYRSRVADAH